MVKKEPERLPDFVKSLSRSRRELHALKARLRGSGLHTVCESARCPNIAECFGRPAAAFMILGNRCTRGCGFCAVGRGDPEAVDAGEAEAVSEAAAALGLEHVVITSVTRDDLADGGAAHFAAVIRSLRSRLPAATVEVLVPDFGGRVEDVETVLAAAPAVFNHNLETVARLYPAARPDADYGRSLEVLAMAAKASGRAGPPLIKSGLMVGLGEEREEIFKVLDDLKKAGAAVVTIGQYLRPRRDRLPVARYWEPAEYQALVDYGASLGLAVFAGPLVRSSYLADLVLGGLSGVDCGQRGQ